VAEKLGVGLEELTDDHCRDQRYLTPQCGKSSPSKVGVLTHARGGTAPTQVARQLDSVRTPPSGFESD